MRKLVFLAVILTLGISSSGMPTAATAAAEIVEIPVPHIWEIPDGSWVQPWAGACEEAAMAMVEQFYLKNQKKFSSKSMKDHMWPYFAIEDTLFGYHVDTSAAEEAELVNGYTAFDAEVKEHPTVDEIQDELRAGRPVISMHYGRALNNPHHAWRRDGSTYHNMVITGFDDNTGEFITNDPELKRGQGYRYDYQVIMDTLHDFDHATKQADGLPVVLFTHPKKLLRANGSHRVYLVRGNVKHYVTRPAVFVNRRWPWSLVQNVDPSVLDALESGPAVSR